MYAITDKNNVQVIIFRGRVGAIKPDIYLSWSLCSSQQSTIFSSHCEGVNLCCTTTLWRGELCGEEGEGRRVWGGGCGEGGCVGRRVRGGGLSCVVQD